ncbi:23S rRNA pseudouridine(1911/1915/1917) synthase [Lentibacillus sp. JNUCC-1]|uniref:RluA family pseudouridine synthase n=1 Tax=Lentibacillus sp. JNUCC-1 TaxID=2654513 RepID=UPI0012E92958|nr:RluA family pseudouridine synthase [Lentibacillus sp. JNUCC-1]MUV36203.1 23S rRNA pseudouridine(1911/1915/1917) synthase [Lentibacillus sp. JNUCC-1]
MTILKHIVTNPEAGIRIDKLLVQLNPDYSRSQIQSWIQHGYVHVNQQQIKGNHKCAPGDKLEWEIPVVEEQVFEGEAIPLDVVYEDDWLLVVNKPRGMVVHPSAGHMSGTLVHALLHHTNHLSDENGEHRRGIVHRIDKDTSGLLLVAKDNVTHQDLARQLADKTVNRRYEAIVHGVIEHESGLIEAPIARDPKNRQKMGVVDHGKDATTHFHVLERFPSFTHISAKLETGRTHQIRVHMKYIGYPVAGDPKYGPRKTLQINGQALHAKIIGFTHPHTKEWMQFEAPLPIYFNELLDKLPNMY